MKTKFSLLKLTIPLCLAFIAPAVFGQTTLIWTNLLMTAPGGYDIGYSTNWSGPAGPGLNRPVSLTTLEWNGTVPGPINVYNDIGNVDNNGGIGTVGGGFGSSGLSFYVNASQTQPVTISTHDSPSSVGMGWKNLTVDAGAGQFTMGQNTKTNAWVVTARPAGATHDLINNSTNPVIINANVEWLRGGGVDFTMEFDSPIATPGSGIGDFGITNCLRGGGDGGGCFLWFVSSGTITWNGYCNPYADIGGDVVDSPIFLNACTTLILKTNSCFSATPGTEFQAIQNNNAFGFPPSPLIYDPGTPADGNNALNMQGVIGGGTSPLISISVWSGKLTLSGTNVFTGDITNKGGELIANRAENVGVSGPFGLYNPGNPVGQRGLIHLNGGTLGWSTNNSYDYSPRFATTPDPVYNFDSGLASVTLGTGLGGATSALTKSGSGTITLSGTSSYGGLTTISNGTLNFSGAKSGSGSVTVGDGAALEANGAVAAMTPGTLTLGQTADVTLDYDNLTNTVSAPIQATTLSAPAGTTVHIVVNSGPFVVGSTYPLFSWGGVAPAPGTHLDFLNGYIGNLVTNVSPNYIGLQITGTAYTWTGNNNNSWDTTTASNWQQNGGPVVFANGFPTLIDDTTINNLNITNMGAVSPSQLSVNNNTNVYQITSSPGNAIAGTTGLTKQGTNTLSLNGGANVYTGVTTISGGTVIVSALANGGLASDLGASGNSAGNLVFDGGTLQYTNNSVQIDRLFTVTTNGGTIDASGVGALQFTNPAALAMSGNLGRTLVLTGSAATNNVMGAAIPDGTSSATALVKNGAGNWILTGTNTYTGVTTVNNGILQIGNGGGSGTLGSGNTTNNGTLIFNRNSALTYGGVISGVGAVTVATNAVTLTGNNSYTGGTSVSNKVTLNLGNGGAGASLAANAPVLNNGFMKFNSTTPITIRGNAATISGAGNFEIAGTGVIGFLGNKTYTGWTLIDPGATLEVSVGNQTTGMGGPNITNNGTLYLQRQDYGVFIITNNIVGTGKVVKDVNNLNPGDITLYGTNTYTGGTIIAGGAIILGDGVTPGSGSIAGNVIFTNSAGWDTVRTLEFNRPDNFTFGGFIGGTNNGYAGYPNFGLVGYRGAVLQNGMGVVTLTNNNNWLDGTIVSNGMLQVGDGHAYGTISTNVLTVNSTMVFNRSDACQFSGYIKSTGLVAQAGSGTLTLSGAINMYDGPADGSGPLGNYGTLVSSNGTMIVNAAKINAGVMVEGGKFVSPAIGMVGTVNISNSLAIDSGALVFSVNKSLAQSNTVYLVSSNLTAGGGTLQLLNYGPAFQVGDRFYLFANADGTHKALNATGIVTVQGPGVTSWNISHLGVDGSVAVQAVADPATEQITAAPSGGNMHLTWPVAWLGAHLQSQTNTLATGLGTNWVSIAGSETATSYDAPLVNTNVFYRLAP